jgi:hypothetical protein
MQTAPRGRRPVVDEWSKAQALTEPFFSFSA